MNHDQWYFAYGSNLSIDQKEQRTGSIRQAVKARLPSYRFAFNKRSGNVHRFANIVPDPDEEVWGVAYLCNPHALESMDEFEGVMMGHYERIWVNVFTPDGERLEAIAYIACEASVCTPGKPAPDYLAKIVSGARHHRLPDSYITRIEELASQPPLS